MGVKSPDDPHAVAFSEALASEIRAEMGRQHMSVRALARAIGMDHVKLNNRLNKEPRSGRAIQFGARELWQVCRVLDISVHDLVDRASVVANDRQAEPPARFDVS